MLRYLDIRTDNNTANSKIDNILNSIYLIENAIDIIEAISDTSSKNKHYITLNEYAKELKLIINIAVKNLCDIEVTAKCDTTNHEYTRYITLDKLIQSKKILNELA